MDAEKKKGTRKARVMSEKEQKAEKDFYFKLGVRMQQARVGARKTQAEIGNALFVTDNTISGFERGTLKPRAYSLLAFCEATGAEPNDLLGYSGKAETETELHIMAKLRGMSDKEKEKLLDCLEILFPREK